jgi:hypothetical protein
MVMPAKIAIQLAQVISIALCGWLIASPLVNANNLPPANDIPEEVLRAEIITEARSPIDGKPLSAAEFAELVIKIEQQLDRDIASTATNNPKLKNLLFLIRLRGFLRSVGIPIK